ncbi:MAG: aromatic ring-hydroxylating dioxygenase subunit alpha [Halioglobus sp.]|nr:aromatic ring-hydroxylating dioxygenase subunit alpha [Halioglobus sp.]
MSAPGFTEVFSHLLEEYREGRAAPPFQAKVDTRFYTDPAWFEKEKAALFSDGPILVGHVAMLKSNGDTFTHDHLGKPIMVVRAGDGEIRAFLNVCRHRGVRLVNSDEVINKTSFVCPYHNWTYGLDGALKHIPLHEESFAGLDAQCHSLKALPLAICEGLIFVNPDPLGSIDLEKHMGMVKADFAAFGMADHVFFRQTVTTLKTNWKLLVDAFQDGYHVTRLHRKTVGPHFIDVVSRSERSGDHLLSVVARNEFADALDLPPEQWDLRRQASCAMYLFPNVEMIIHPDYISYLAFFPTKVDETVVVHGCFIEEEPQNEKARAHWERAFDIIENGVFRPEDYFVCEQAQIGMSSGANSHLLLGAHETGVKAFHDLLAEKMGPYLAE